jgi:hypothetical protein
MVAEVEVALVVEVVAEVISLEAVEEVAEVANLSFDKSNCLNKSL